ncbi:hypothetical protein [Spiroplasma endosymbiont of Aspidapion aeneum]|uniref:hypothetical protein n=1 Tax=Spiroplasma endosymbiont of Aspidapion aeneum TaxID=3066276 RepID=UPI00313D0504
MQSWAFMVLIIMSLMEFSLWILFFNYWIINSTDFVNKTLIWLYTSLLALANIIIIWIPIFVFTNPVSLAWFSLPLMFIPIIIGHFIFHFFRK